MKNLIALIGVTILTFSANSFARVTLICNSSDLGEFSIRVTANAMITSSQGVQILECQNCDKTDDETGGIVKFTPIHGSRGIVPAGGTLGVAYNTPRVESEERNAPVPRTPVEVTVDGSHLFDCYSEQ